MNEYYKKIKPHKISPMPKGVRTEDVTLEDAIGYLRVPRVLGQTKSGDNITVNIGRFGPFILVKKNYYSIKPHEDYDVYTITLPIALNLIKLIDEERAKALLCDFPKEDIKVLVGKYGIYIKSGKKNYKLPKGMEEDEIRKLSLAKVKDIING